MIWFLVIGIAAWDGMSNLVRTLWDIQTNPAVAELEHRCSGVSEDARGIDKLDRDQSCALLPTLESMQSFGFEVMSAGVIVVFAPPFLLFLLVLVVWPGRRRRKNA